MCAALNSCNLGYDMGVSGSVAHVLQLEWGLQSWEVAIFIGIINLMAIPGAFCGSLVSDWFGRRAAFGISAVTFVCGCVLMALSPSFGFIMIGRCILGLGVGFGLAIDPVYIAEVSDADVRGSLVTWSEVGLNAGLTLGFVAAYLFRGAHMWHTMLLLGGVLPMIMLVLTLTILPESPRWLVAHGYTSEAEATLRSIGHPADRIPALVHDISLSIAEERAAIAGEGPGFATLLCCPPPSIGRMLLAGVGVAICQQLSGIDAVQYFMIFTLQAQGVPQPELMQIGLGVVKLVPILAAGVAFDYFGRRPVLLLSLGGTTLGLALLGLSFALPSGAWGWSVLGYAIYFASFSMGLGPGAWLIAAETFPTLVRSRAMSLATALNRAVAALVATGYLPLAEAMGFEMAAFVLAGVNVLIFVYLYALLPETRGRTLEEMLIFFVHVTKDETPFAQRMLAEAKKQVAL